MRTTLHGIQALRGVACLVVVAVHVACWERAYGASTPGLTAFRWFGFAGVDLFFALSGFIIWHANAGLFGRPRAAPGFLARRAWRIFPAYWAMMLLVPPLYLVVNGWPLDRAGTTADWLGWLGLLPGWGENQIVPPAWSLVFEAGFYLAFGLLILLPARLAGAALAGWAAVIVAVAAAGGAPTDAQGEWPLSPLVLEFLMGCAGAAAVRAGRVNWGRAALAAGVAWFAAGAVTLYVRYPGGPDPLTAVQRVAAFGPASALIVYGVAAVERLRPLTPPRWLRATGDASYSIYLWHGPVYPIAVAYGCYLPHSKLLHPIWLALTFAVCIGGGFALHRLVERPLANLGRRKQPVAATVVPAGAVLRRAA